MTSVVIIDTILLLLVTITAIAIIEVRNLYASAMLTSVYSLLMALVWVNMHSMDVAFTEAAVGGGISTILLIGTLVHTAREEKLLKVRIHWKAAAVTALTGAALIYGTFDMPRFGDPKAPIHHYRVPEMMAQTVGFVNGTKGKQAPPEGFDARAYRSFDEKPSLAGSYTSGWWGGLSLAHEITSPHDPSVRVPISIIGAFDLGIPAGSQKETLRGYIGVGFLLKKAGY